MEKPAYLVLGSGISALSFAALMAHTGRSVKLLEAHEYPGGYGHTFPQGEKYRFNAQLHYVWNCGEGQPVYQVLEHLGLHEDVTFERYNPDGFDRMRMPGYELDIPADYGLLGDRLTALFPNAERNIRAFLDAIQVLGEGIGKYEGLGNPLYVAQNLKPHLALARYHKATLQEVFDAFALPKEAQTLLALQWPDFLLPPNQLSIIAWAGLFDGYMHGAFYPTNHFEHVIQSLERVILENGGEILYEHRVVDFILDGDRVAGVIAEDLANGHERSEHFGADIVCNIDPQQVASMIGEEKFSPRVRKLLNYDYSPSNFMAYCAVEDIDLPELGFEGTNLFHASEVDLNESFYKMYTLGDYSTLSYALTTPTLHSAAPGTCPEGQHIIEFLTVANYQRFLEMRLASQRAYREKKNEILNRMIDLTEERYIPNLREKMVFKITGSPTTSERYCNAPRGNSYGSNLTPRNMGRARLDHRSSLRNFYFCNASAGYAGFAGTFRTGARLFEKLTGEKVITRSAS